VIRPGIYSAGTPVKLVFKDDGKREGYITDVFALPRAELTEDQWRKRPLVYSDIDWHEPKPPKYSEDAGRAGKLAEVRREIAGFFAGVNRSPRNQARLRVLDFSVRIVTGGGSVACAARNGAMELLKDVPAETTSILAVEDPSILSEWTRGKALTNLFALGELWLSNREGVRLLEDLDRLWRAATRDGVL
jgi:hypothetical protein